MNPNPCILYELVRPKLSKKVDFYEKRVQKWLRWYFEVTIVYRDITWQG
jgi:hypothetical protein